MPENLLGILKLCLLALLYLFFLRVLWAVWSEIRGPSVRDAKPAKAASAGRAGRAGRKATARRAGASRLVVTSPNGGKQARRAYEVGSELTLGRAPGCQVPLEDDTFVSQVHARVFVVDGQLFVEDLGSTNGTYLNGQRVSAATPMRRGDSLQVGRTVMEVT